MSLPSNGYDILKLTIYHQVNPNQGDGVGYIIEPIDKESLPVELYQAFLGWDEAKQAVTSYIYFEDRVEIKQAVVLEEVKEALSQYFREMAENVVSYARQVRYLVGEFEYL